MEQILRIFKFYINETYIFFQIADIKAITIADRAIEPQSKNKTKKKKKYKNKMK